MNYVEPLTLVTQPRLFQYADGKQAIEQIASHSSHRERARSLQEDIHRAGGYRTAVEDIITYTERFASSSRHANDTEIKIEVNRSHNTDS